MAKRADLLSSARRRVKNWLQCKFQPWRVTTCGGIRVHYKQVLDGGGSSFGQELAPFLAGRGMPRQARVFEWCAGPAFIGFSLLGSGLCETLSLADINPASIAACRRTIADNGLSDRVTVYRSDNLSAIPAQEQWDLVVGNPPFFDHGAFHLRAHDRDWALHREFFSTIAPFLRPGAVIVLQEDNLGSTAETFRKMIEGAGLTIVFVEGCQPVRTLVSRIYCIGIMRQGDAVPAWARGPIAEEKPPS